MKKKTKKKTQPTFNLMKASWNQLVKLCNEYKLNKIIHIVTALQGLKDNPSDLPLKEYIVENILERQQLNLITPDPFRNSAPTKSDDIDGPIVIGKTTNNTFFGVHPNIFTQGGLLIGTTGSGKTQILLLIALQFVGVHNES